MYECDQMTLVAWLHARRSHRMVWRNCVWNIRLTVKVSPRIPVTLLLYSGVFALPVSVLISSFVACLHSLVPFSSCDVQCKALLVFL